MRPIDADRLIEILESARERTTGIYGDLGGAVSGCVKHAKAAPTVDMETMDTWGRTTETAITALKEQIAQLQRGLDELAAKLDGICDIPLETTWKTVNDPPKDREQVYVSDGSTYGFGKRMQVYGGYHMWDAVGIKSNVKYWMQIPKLPDVAVDPEDYEPVWISDWNAAADQREGRK